MELDNLVGYNATKNKKHSTSIDGYRGDINLFVRSTWEANVARVLIFKGIPFEYEPETFKLTVPTVMKSIFDGREEVKYTPDFYLPTERKYLEVKSDWFAFGDEQAMAKIILFRMLDPARVVKILGVAQYRKLEKDYKCAIESDKRFAGWERGSRVLGPNLATHPNHFGKTFFQGKSKPGRFLEEHYMLLEDITRYPSGGLVERYNRLGWSMGRGRRVLSDLANVKAIQLSSKRAEGKKGGRPSLIANVTSVGEGVVKSFSQKGTFQK